MKKRIILIVSILILVIAILSGIAAAKSKPREVYLHGVEQEDGTIVYEGEDGSQVILGTW